MSTLTTTLNSDMNVVAAQTLTLNSDMKVVPPPLTLTLNSDMTVTVPTTLTLSLSSDMTVAALPPTPPGPPAPTVPLFACAVAITCPGSDSPIANISAETSDGPSFHALQFPSVDPSQNPNPINQGFVAVGCISTCTSTLSQADADLCAQNQAFVCQHTNPVTGVAPFPIFLNQPQTATAHCPDGTPFTFTVAQGQFLALNQAQANNMAKSYAQQQVNAHMICLSALSTTTAFAGMAFTGNLTATGNLSPFPFSDLWEVTAGALPDGLDINEAFVNGGQNSITGTPTTGGTFTFSIRVTNVFGDFIEKIYSITVTQTNFTVTPDILSGTVSFFNSGLSFPAGQYTVNYVNGAYKPAALLGYQVWDYRVDYGPNTHNFLPVSAGVFPTQAQAEAANAGASFTFMHPGGAIGMWLSDSFYPDNVAGVPNPTFSLVNG